MYSYSMIKVHKFINSPTTRPDNHQAIIITQPQRVVRQESKSHAEDLPQNMHGMHPGEYSVFMLTGSNFKVNQNNWIRHLVGSKCYEATAVQLIAVYDDKDSAPHQLNLKILVLKVR